MNQVVGDINNSNVQGVNNANVHTPYSAKAGILPIIAIVLSAASIVISCLRIEPIKADWLGILVGVLSLLVATLIGWNIFYALDIRREMYKRTEDVRADIIGRLNQHSKLNDKDFKNIWDALKRAESFCNKLDECVLETMKNVKDKG